MRVPLELVSESLEAAPLYFESRLFCIDYKEVIDVVNDLVNEVLSVVHLDGVEAKALH